MRSHRDRSRAVRVFTLGLTAIAGVLGLAAAPAHGGQRRFLVTLADAPKQFGCVGGAADGTPCDSTAQNACPGGVCTNVRQLPNKQQIENVYFNNPDSFAAFWREISYGNVTISGRVTDWLQLPWPIRPAGPNVNGSSISFIDLDGNERYRYGSGEKFNNAKAMVTVDVNGDPRGNDDGPFSPGGNPPYARGARNTASNGTPVWTPGERFLDMDADGRWDGYDEAGNSMDWLGRTDAQGNPIGDGRPDLLGPWVDLDGDGVPNNDSNCTYLRDSDNDRNPDCCPNGPGTPPAALGCEGLKKDGTGTKACPAMRWPGPNNTTITDCNGNLIDDAIDIASGTSFDRLPYTGSPCVPGQGDGTPDECQFLKPDKPCANPPLNCAGENRDPCCAITNNTTCAALPPAQLRFPVTVARCEFFDGNGDGQLDIVEPFENGIVVAKIAALADREDPDFCVDVISDEYIRANFPGQIAESVIARGQVQPVYGQHDPDNKLGTGICCCDAARTSNCPPELRCKTVSLPDGTSLTRACKAGEHAQYDPPDEWTDAGPGPKMRVDKKLLRRYTTPEPSWYQQTWRDRYNGAEPPPWTSQTLAAVPAPSSGPTARREFIANRGGLLGNGTGWIGCDVAIDPRVQFATGLCAENSGFEPVCDRRILPEETAGIGAALLTFDGGVEFDDLPSSKYHRGGDEGLGEVTSPFTNDIWGQDRGTNIPDQSGVDFIIPAAGPYATKLHGQLGRDAGNVLQMEILTWRRGKVCAGGDNAGETCVADEDCPVTICGVVPCPDSTCREYVNTGAAWEALHGPHPFAGPSGLNLGFRDYNLDGLIDLGESVVRGSENYMLDPNGNAPFGTSTDYPWNRRRLLEDCIEVLDDSLDFDDLVDPVAMDAVTCGGGQSVNSPVPFGGSIFPASGFLSGVVILPRGTKVVLEAEHFPFYYPIHNEDGLNDFRFAEGVFPRPPGNAQLNWSLSFHDQVMVLRPTSGGGITHEAAQTPHVAFNYGITWEHFPTLWDLDRVDNPDAENCPVGAWDLMADGGLVHPAPVLKEAGCTNWVEPVDLTAVLTPGVDRVITLPPAEFVRDDSYYFLENEDRAGERYWFWRAGSGFDGRMPGEGVLIMHTDVGSNPDALPPQQRSGDRPAYLIVQADGLSQLQACENRPVPGSSAVGDAGDPWPGTSNRRTFNCDTIPASEWYTEDACTGLEVRDIVLDPAGSAAVTFNWTPTSVPSLRFIDPPGGVSVGNPPNAIYNIRTEATDVYGGTWIRFFHTSQGNATPNPATAPLIQLVRKTTPGNHALSVNWKLCTPVGENCVALPDGRYFLFADLIPDRGADGTERKFSTPRAGRNNQGTATLQVLSADVLTSTIQNGQVTSNGKARSETWIMRCTNSTTGEWVVNSSLTHPAPAPGTPGPDPSPRALTGQKFTSAAGGVSFTIQTGTGAFPKGALGDTFTFTTTGITALSEAVTLRGGQIKEDPTAVIVASPLSGLPPLTVSFDARGSIDPNGQPLQFRWTWGDGSPTETGPQKTHTFTLAGTFTVVLRATNPANSRFDEAAVDIQVINNSPNAVIRATPVSGPGPLTVKFNATQSSDLETPAEQLKYQWTYGDGASANDAGLAGAGFREVQHTYSKRADGTSCTTANPCTFTATLKVTDSGGKTDTDTVVIQVGNTNPVANISTTALSGSSPLTVTLNAKNSTDPENDPLEVEWFWDDPPTPNETYKAKTGKPPATDGSVPHTFTTTKTFAVKATVYDLKADGTRKGGVAQASVKVTVTTAVTGDSDPRAIFCFQTPTDCVTTSPTLAVDQSFTVDGSRSFDNPAGGRISAYTWDWGDRTPSATGAVQSHAYSAAGTYTITLTVADGDSPPHTGRTPKSVVVTQEGGEPPPPSTNHPPSAIFVISPPEAFVGDVVNFDARSSSDPDPGDELRYRWVFGDGNETQFTTTNLRTTHTYASPGSYLVRLTVRDAANASTDATQTVRVLLEGDNRTPVAMIATGPRAGTAPLTLTFDGRISYDPDGTPITYRWEFRQNGELIDTMTGSVVTRVFATPGDYTVELVVKDPLGPEGRSEPESILVTESSAAPPPEPPPPHPAPEEPPDSAAQRPAPTTMCGLGMLPGLLASLAGLTLTAMTRRRLKG